jgi:hypothetical protein
MRPSTLLIRAVLLAVATVLLAPAPAPAATDPQVRVLAVRVSADDQVSVVGQLRPKPRARLGAGAVTVTSGGRTQPVAVQGLMSDPVAVGLVIDASAGGAASLAGGGRSGAASFLLQLPSAAGITIIADRRPPVAASRSAGVAEALRATSDLRSSGTRATSEALTLALRQLPPEPRTPRVIALYTSAPDAGGESAAELGDRLRRANAVLAVLAAVDAGAVPRYWRDVARSTGGLAVAARPGQAISAFDALAEGLRSRYTMTFTRTPGADQAQLRVDLGRRVLTAAVTVPQAPAGGETPGGASDAGAVTPSWFWGLVAAILAVIVGAGIVLRRRRSRPVPALPGVRVFDLADPDRPREITNLFESRMERDARAVRGSTGDEEDP